MSVPRPIRHPFLKSALLIVQLLFALALCAQTTPQDFSIVLLPDTQYYSESHPSIFKQQTQWIVNNRSAWNIQFVLGEGDIVNEPGQSFEWTNADAAIKILDTAAMPYVLAIGNHDYDGIAPAARGTTAYNQWFGVSRYINKPWYGGHFGSTNESFYGSFTVNGQRYIVLALEYYPRDNVLAWADALMTDNPDAQFLITTHSFEYTDGARQDTCDTQDMRSSTGRNAETVWQTVLKHHANVQLVVNGHLIGNNTAHRSDLGENGNIVHQIFTNFQNLTNGGNGWLRILKFRPSLNTIEVYTYSPTLNQFNMTAAHQFKLPITNTGNQAITGAMEGKVRTPGCVAIPGAKVTADGTTVSSDSRGYYKIPNLAPDSDTTVSVAATGYGSQTKSNVIYPGFATQTNFLLNTAATASCTLSTTDPSVTICTPAPNATLPSPVHLNAGATASAGVSNLQVYVDGVNQKTFYSSALDTQLTLANGPRRITVQAKLNNGLTTKKTIYITVGTATTPGVTMTSPTNNSTVSNPVSVKATAVSNAAISYMQLYIDGVKKFQVSGNTMSTTITLTAGTHRVTTQAKDANGVYYKATANITVK
jgi:hypothetical protein